MERFKSHRPNTTVQIRRKLVSVRAISADPIDSQIKSSLEQLDPSIPFTPAPDASAATKQLLNTTLRTICEDQYQHDALLLETKLKKKLSLALYRKATRKEETASAVFEDYKLRQRRNSQVQHGCNQIEDNLLADCYSKVQLEWLARYHYLQEAKGLQIVPLIQVPN